ncbi:MAG: acyltransferase domain-containing protein, partial [bacterium]|nr:acyltransferase domain-containing protein [bacterium]
PLGGAGGGRSHSLLILSAKTTTALEKAAENLGLHLNASPGINLADAAYTLQLGRSHFQHRRMLTASETGEAAELLLSKDSRNVRSGSTSADDRTVVFMFSGLGSEYINMGLDLYREEPDFAEEMDRCFEILDAAGHDLREVIYPAGQTGKTVGELPEEAVQPLLFSFEYALSRLLIKWGVTPWGMIGYSFGEYTAACIAGVFSLEDALKLVIARGRLMSKSPAGAMLSVPLTREELEPLLDQNSELSLGIDNGPSCIVSGSPEAVETFERQLKEKRLMSMRLPLSHPLHSPNMEPVLKEFEEVVKGFELKEPQIPYISNVTGKWIVPEDAVSPAYWANHLGQTVYFADGVKELLKETNALFVQIGPGRDLFTLMSRYVTPESEQEVINLVRPREKEVSDVYYLLTKIGQLWLYGQEVDWVQFNSFQERSRIPLPTYPFERRLFRLKRTLLGKDGQLNIAALEQQLPETDTGPMEDEGRSLSSGGTQRPHLMSEYVSPSTPVQEQLVRIFGNLFGFENIGIRDDFFEMGGDSLKAMTVSATIHQALHVEIPVPQFFDRPTVEKLAEFITDSGRELTYSEVEPVEFKEYYPVSAAQKRLYILQQMEPNLINYNLPTVVLIEGQTDIPVIESSFKRLVERHESLRTSFHLINDQAMQRVHDFAPLDIQWHEANNTEPQELIDRFVGAFHLSEAPLLRVGLIKLGENRHLVMLDMHHIISDGTSLTIFFKEFMSLYAGQELEPLLIQYKDYSGWQAHENETGSLQRQEEYWVKQLSGDLPALNLPADFPRPIVQSFEGKKDNFPL